MPSINTDKFKIIVNNLSYETTNEDLEQFFSEVGPVKRAFIIKNNVGHSRGYGFIEFSDETDAISAVKLTGKTINGREIRIDRAGMFHKLGKKKKQRRLDHMDFLRQQKHKQHDDEDESEPEAPEEPQKKDPEELNMPKNWDVVVWPLPLKAKDDAIRAEIEQAIGTKGVEAPGEITIEKVEFDIGRCKQAILSYKKKSFTVANALHKTVMLGNTVMSCVLEQRSYSKLCRLILRNLPNNLNIKTLKSFVRRAGEVSEYKMLTGYGFCSYYVPSDAERALKLLNNKRLGNRTIHVDMCMDREDYEEYQEKLKEEEGYESEEEEESEEEDHEYHPSDDEDFEEEEPNEEEKPKEEEEPKENDGEERRKWVESDIFHKKKVFLVGISETTTEKDVMDALKAAFGRVKLPKLINKVDHGLRNGFATFRKESGAKRAVEAKTVEIDGREVQIHYAMTRNDVADAKKVRDEERKKDKRNLYLALEGHIGVEEAQRQGMSEQDIRLRMSSHHDRKAKLADANWFVSRTRLSVRNLPMALDEAELEKMARTSCKEGLALLDFEANDKLKKISETPHFHQVKIVRDKDRLNKQGVFRSKGFGFVEFKNHTLALACLRYMNNNPTLLNGRRMVVEFALENVQKLRKLKRTQAFGKSAKDIQEAKVVSRKIKKFRDKRRQKAAKLMVKGMPEEEAKAKAEEEYQGRLEVYFAEIDRKRKAGEEIKGQPPTKLQKTESE
ncbi:hypothetical protein PCE1_003569 [Barthelona sp. PCE]